MELKLLRAFVVVCELRHFGRAAQALHVSQPALSKQIAALEQALGARLFERGRHGAELTAFGAGFLPGAQTLIRDADELLARAREASRGTRGHLRIGLGLSTLTLAPQLIAEFRRHHPDVGVSLNDLSSAEQTHKLVTGKLDAGFLRMPVDARLVCFPVLSEALVLALPRHAKWKRLPADLGVLNELGWVALGHDRGPGLAAQIARWCGEHDFVPRVIQHADDIQSVLAAVAAGVGAAFLPSGAGHLLRDARIVPLRDQAARWQVGVAWQSENNNAVVTNFIEFVRRAVARA